jgi:hypothetical protein
MMEFNMRKPSLDNRVHTLPAQASSVSTPAKGTPPVSGDLVAERTQGVAIVGNTVVTVVPFNNGPQPFALLSYGKMHALSRLDSYVEKLGSHSLGNRSPSDRVHFVLPLLRTNMREAEEVKRIRFTSFALIPVVDGPGAKLQNSRLLGMKFKTELEHALFQIGQRLLGLRFVFKTQYPLINL